jgi:hypothetical protein
MVCRFGSVDMVPLSRPFSQHRGSMTGAALAFLHLLLINVKWLEPSVQQHTISVSWYIWVFSPRCLLANHEKRVLSTSPCTEIRIVVVAIMKKKKKLCKVCAMRCLACLPIHYKRTKLRKFIYEHHYHCYHNYESKIDQMVLSNSPMFISFLCVNFLVYFPTGLLILCRIISWCKIWALCRCCKVASGN